MRSEASSTYSVVSRVAVAVMLVVAAALFDSRSALENLGFGDTANGQAVSAEVNQSMPVMRADEDVYAPSCTIVVQSDPTCASEGDAIETSLVDEGFQVSRAEHGEIGRSIIVYKSSRYKAIAWQISHDMGGVQTMQDSWGEYSFEGKVLVLVGSGFYDPSLVVS